MNKRERWKESVTQALELPGDLARGDAIVTLTGRTKAVVENYRGLLCYTREEIVLSIPGGRLRIRGKELRIPWYTPVELEIGGRISGIQMERR
ncbi:MAG: YabP/YqfC family sporulation protein [Clostridiales bacterium]|nr:YabP/YqfC family sporulation protein [Clostridiales bacterium]